MACLLQAHCDYCSELRLDYVSVLLACPVLLQVSTVGSLGSPFLPSYQCLSLDLAGIPAWRLASFWVV